MASYGVSERRACSLADLDRSTFQYLKREGGEPFEPFPCFAGPDELASAFPHAPEPVGMATP